MNEVVAEICETCKLKRMCPRLCLEPFGACLEYQKELTPEKNNGGKLL